MKFQNVSISKSVRVLSWTTVFVLIHTDTWIKWFYFIHRIIESERFQIDSTMMAAVQFVQDTVEKRSGVETARHREPHENWCRNIQAIRYTSIAFNRTLRFPAAKEMEKSSVLYNLFHQNQPPCHPQNPLNPSNLHVFRGPLPFFHRRRRRLPFQFVQSFRKTARELTDQFPRNRRDTWN